MSARSSDKTDERCSPLQHERNVTYENESNQFRDTAGTGHADLLAERDPGSAFADGLPSDRRLGGGMHRGGGDAPADVDVCLGRGPERLWVAGMTTRVWTSAEGVRIELDEAALAEKAQTFRKALQPFGLDRFVSDMPERILDLPDGRALAEFRTMMLPVWYPEKLNELAAAGFEAVTVIRQCKTRPPQLMYYVRSVQEISGGNYGNQ